MPRHRPIEQPLGLAVVEKLIGPQTLGRKRGDTPRRLAARGFIEHPIFGRSIRSSDQRAFGVVDHPLQRIDRQLPVAAGDPVLGALQEIDDRRRRVDQNGGGLRVQDLRNRSCRLQPDQVARPARRAGAGGLLSLDGDSTDRRQRRHHQGEKPSPRAKPDCTSRLEPILHSGKHRPTTHTAPTTDQPGGRTG